MHWNWNVMNSNIRTLQLFNTLQKLKFLFWQQKKPFCFPAACELYTKKAGIRESEEEKKKKKKKKGKFSISTFRSRQIRHYPKANLYTENSYITLKHQKAQSNLGNARVYPNKPM